MEKVTGFLTHDGTFFQDEDEAELYDATQGLDDALLDMNVNGEKFRNAAVICSEAVLRFLEAHRNVENNKAHDLAGEESAEGVFKQSVGSSQHLPYLGGSEQPEAVQHDGQGDGIRSGGDDAPSLRRRSRVAARAHRQAT